MPRRASLDLSTVNEGEIIVRDIVGDLELENVNGPITATNITGSVIAESVNNPITVGLTGVAAGGATSLSSLNGDITLRLPASAKAELHLDSSRGEDRVGLRAGREADQASHRTQRGPRRRLGHDGGHHRRDPERRRSGHPHQDAERRDQDRESRRLSRRRVECRATRIDSGAAWLRRRLLVYFAAQLSAPSRPPIFPTPGNGKWNA